MIWTQSADLPLVQMVAKAIVDDIVATGAAYLDGRYGKLAPTLFANTPLTISFAQASLSDLTVITAQSGPNGISLKVGVQRRPNLITTDALITIAGALCQELVHQKQRARDLTSYDMAASVQTEWHKSRPSQPSPVEWLMGYLGTVYEFEAHAEQIACELWLLDTIAGHIPRKSVSLATVNQSEPLRRIRHRLLPAGTMTPEIKQWFTFLDSKINEALASW